ncbi:MAG: hypothetical protein SGARI_007276 [Bacillariaceae sp.]
MLLQQRCGQSFQLIEKQLDDKKGLDENENDVAPFPRDDDPFLFMDDLSSFMSNMVSAHDLFFSDDAVRNRGSPFPSRHNFLRGSFLSQLPQYNGEVVVDDEHHFQVFLDLSEGTSMENVQIEVQDGGTRLVIHGETTRHSSASNGDGEDAVEKRALFGFQWSASSTITKSFAESFSIDSSVRVDQMVATWQDGRLMVFAPKGEQQGNVKNSNRVIPIQDLNAIGAGTDESSKESMPEDVNNKEPPFLHKGRLPIVQQGVTAHSEENGKKANEETLETVESSVSGMDDSKEDENTIRESGDFLGGSSL